MPQETNLNVSPYFDDFDPNKNYHKVLFKPGYPVQARELTTLQSILQNQVEQFGNNIFKEGAKVIPGQTIFNSKYSAVEIDNSFSGILLSSYVSKLVGTTIRGDLSGVRARVEAVLTESQSEKNSTTLYVSYISSSSNNVSGTFEDNENLVTETGIQSSNIIFIENESFATTKSQGSTSDASSFTVQNGVYFLRGAFVNVPTQTIILDQYSNKPSYRIGFDILEEIITSDVDESLFDNAQGFNNFSSPGADRFKISAILTKKNITDFDDTNFVEIAVVQDGIVRNNPNDTQYNYITDTLASRTFEESGNYYVKPFKLSCLESLNDNEGNNGVFKSNQLTYEGNSPSDDLFVYRLTPGKAYVKGYRTEINSPTFLDVEKSRDTKELKNQSINYFTGPSFALNNVSGSPEIGINTTYTVSLRSSRIDDDKVAAGNEIGVARVYDFALESGSYNTTLLDANEWNVSLYDVQTFTEITLNTEISLDRSTRVKGRSSGAVGYLQNAISRSKTLKLNSTKGSFINGESFSFNGIDNGRISVATTAYGLNDVKSIYGNSGIGGTFNSDTAQTNSINLGESTISGRNTVTNRSTVAIPNTTYSNTLRKGGLLSYFDSSKFVLEQSSFRGITTSITSTDGSQDIEVDHTVGATEAYVNGIKLSTDGYVSVGSSILRLRVAPEVGDVVEVVKFREGIRNKQEIIAYDGQSVIPFTTTTALRSTDKDNTQIFINGVAIKSDDFDINTTGSGNIRVNETLEIGSNIEIVDYGLGDLVGLSTFTPDTPRTSFNVVYNPNRVEVYANGVRLNKSEYTSSNGTAITLNNGTIGSGDVLEVVERKNNIVSSATTYTAVGLQTSFTATYTPGNVEVFYNGVKLKSDEYNSTSGTSIDFVTPSRSGDVVEIVAYPSGIRNIVTSNITSESQDRFSLPNSARDFEVFVDGIKLTKNDYALTRSDLSYVLDYPVFSGDHIEINLFDRESYGTSTVTALEGQTEVNFNYSLGFLDVYLNGVKIDPSNYNANNGQTIVFYEPLFAGDIVQAYNYSTSAFVTPFAGINNRSFAEITDIDTNGDFTIVTVKGVASVVGVNEGSLPTRAITVSDLQFLKTKVPSSSDNTLFTPLPRRNISEINLSSSQLTVKKQYDVNITSNSTNTVFAGANETFLPYDEERYVLTFLDGTVQPLRKDMFVFSAGGTRLTINGLEKNGQARLITTLKKINVKSKSKKNRKSSSLIISKSTNSSSGIGTTTLNDGLAHGAFPYGTRVQDDEISLNTPDVIEIHGVFESFGNDDPSSPRLTLSSLTGPNATTIDLIVGETFTGTTSNAKGVFVERRDDQIIEFVYLNNNTFSTSEKIVFAESGIESIISLVSSHGKDITQSFTLDNGQRDTFYDYGRLVRQPGKNAPSRKIKVYFKSGFYDANDDGDITTINSYQDFDYAKEIEYYNDTRTSDLIDIRPRVSDYTVTAGSRSPFEFYGRNFSQSGNSAKNIIAPDESINLDYSFYLPRIDKIFLNKNGLFKIVKGVSSENPTPPEQIEDSIEVGEIFIPPFLYNVDNCSIIQKKYKRYTMRDISRLEGRITDLERFTTLSMLESDTANLFISDKSGLNRFKSGFLVDNFKNSTNQEERIGVKNSINPNYGEMRPSHYTTSVDLLLGSDSVIGAGQTSNPYVDLNFVNDIKGTNVVKTGDILSLNYEKVEWLSQTFATRTEKVSPYLVNFWEGTVELSPDSDTWVDTVKVTPSNLSVSGNFTSSIDKFARSEGYNAQNGFIPSIWESWNILWSGNSKMLDNSAQADQKSIYPRFFNTDDRSSNNGDIRWVGLERTGSGYTIESITSDNDTSATQSIATQEFNTNEAGEKVVSDDITSYVRSRNVKFKSEKLKPSTRMYAFFDGVDVNEFIVPKLIEVTMVSGKFTVGETISGYVPGLDYSDVSYGANPKITFRAAVPNHKSGPYNNPTKTYEDNPYNSALTVPAAYSSTSTILNVDTFSLANEPQGEYFGFIKRQMRLYGETSGAEAVVQDVRLVSDKYGEVAGSFFIPDPNVGVNPKFESGDKVFKLTNSDQNSSSIEVVNTLSEGRFYSSGSVQIIKDDVSSVKNARKVDKLAFKDSDESSFQGRYLDPLAQTFTVDDETGVFLTGLDVFFEEKDSELPITCQIRTVDVNRPSDVVVPFTEVTLIPSEVSTSSNASVATHFEFSSPAFLDGNREYAIVLLSNSNNYSVWTSRLGEFDVKSNVGSSSKILVSTQQILGSLFKSQNAANWQPSVYEDLTFKLYRADFVDSGNVSFYNPTLSEGNGHVSRLLADPIQSNSKKLRVNLSSALSDTNLILGNSVVQLTTGANGDYVGSVGSVGRLKITNSGIGYEPSAGRRTYTDVSLSSTSGTGKSAVATIIVSNGSIESATITSGGFGYEVGDVVTAELGTKGLGTNLRLTVETITSVNQIILDNVQGNFSAGIANTIFKYTSTGLASSITNSSGEGLYLRSGFDEVTDGLTLKVNHKNHGMHSTVNFVTISDVSPNSASTRLTVSYDKDFNGQIAVDDLSEFEKFENVVVSTSNPGYALVNGEVIKYEGVDQGKLTTITRGIDSTVKKSISSGDLIYKYEFNGVSLRRINKTHKLDDSSGIGLDYYNIVIDTSDIDYGTNRSSSQSTFVPLYFNSTVSGGGRNIRATQNIQFEAITPNVQNFVPTLTNIDSSIRTVSGTSVSGSEVSFLDQGFESINLNQTNYLSSPRLIASKINEKNLLTTLPGNKSFTMLCNMASNNSKLSPMIDLTRVNLITSSNRINSEVEDFILDPRVKTLFDDPSACQYVTKVIRLKNPASSLKLYMMAHINNFSDIRAFYSIDNDESNDPVFIPFPGYLNLNPDQEIVDATLNSGLPDRFLDKNYINQSVSNNESYSNYEFTANNLPEFKYFRVKIVMTSTNQAYVPKIKNMRAIALA